MDEVKSSLLKIVGYQLFGGERPGANADMLDILNEAKGQTVFTTVFPFLQDVFMKQFHYLFLFLLLPIFLLIYTKSYIVQYCLICYAFFWEL